MPVVYLGGNPDSLLGSLQQLHIDVSRIRSGQIRNPDNLNLAPILNNWGLAARSVTCLVGAVTDHPLLGDRPVIRTSELFAIDLVAGWARTWSRFYRLGVPAGGFPGGGNA